MDSSCPFMAIHAAMGGDTNSELDRKSSGKIPLVCPMSGRRANAGQDGIHQASSDSEEDGAGNWRTDHHDLGVIPEDMESEVREGWGQPTEEVMDNPQGSPHASLAGSMRSLRSVSQIGSKASGIRAHVPGGSRISSSHSHSDSKSRGTSKKSGRRKKAAIRVREITRTNAPSFSVAEHKENAPLVKKSWGLLLAHVPWDRLGQKLYDAIFTVAPSLQGMFSKSSVAMGIKMVDMIDSMVNNLDDMEVVHKKMESLGPVHHRNAVHANEHMAVFETVVTTLLQQVLKEMYTDDMHKAWHWLWGWLTESMFVVEQAYNSSASLIQQSWDSATSSATLESIGGCIYETLFEIAPNLRHLFSKPKEIMAMKLVNIVGMLVTLSANPETVDEVIRDLGKRHVTYGVASHHVPVMKQAIISVLEKLLIDNWTTETSKAWNELWDLSATAMMKAIDEGRDYGSAIENMWQRIEGHTTRQKFALQLYSRLTNANPELVLVFMQAGGTGPKMDEHKGEDDDDSAGVRTVGTNFGTAGGGAGGAGGAGAGPASLMTARGGPGQSVMSSRGGAAGLSTVGTRPGGTSGMMSSRMPTSGPPKRSTLMTMVDVIERVTGLDLDGDGTVGGDVLAEEDDIDLVGGSSAAAKKTKFSRLSWGLEIWDLVRVAIELMYEPELQKQRLTVIAARFFGYGCKVSHLKTIGMALQGVLGEMLIVHTKTPWSAAESAAWDWFWGHVEASMRCTIEAYEAGVADTVHRDWKAIQAAHTDEEFGTIFFSEIKAVAPDFLRLFVRPKRMQYSTFIDQMEMFIGFSSAPEEFYDQIKSLAIRHIKYGVTAQMIKHYGAVVKNVLRRTLGDNFNEVSQKAWDYVWNGVSRCVADCLSVGSNLVTVALVAGEVEELERALSLAPRGQRADWITRVQIHDSVISPLYWAVRDGKLDMARVMIRDLLALRADREAYYYGYDQLWAVHPDIVTVLCKICPDLLEDLFDGMLWHSAVVEDGDKVRVNYYLRELYGDPDVFPDAWGTPFGVLALQGPTSIFIHPLVTKVLDIKWRNFGKKWFLVLEGWYTLVLVIFQIAFVTNEHHDCSKTSLRLAAGGLAAATFAGQALLILGQIRAGQVGMVRLPLTGWGISLPRWMHKRWNNLRIVSMGILAFIGLYDPCIFLKTELEDAQKQAALLLNSTAGYNSSSTAAADFGVIIMPGTTLSHIDIACALVAILLWFGTFQFCTLVHRLSAFMFTVGTLVSDVTRIIAVLALLTLGFGTSLARIQSNVQDSPFSTFDGAVYSLLRRTLQLDPPQMDTVTAFGWLFFLLYALLATIGMLNILIAQLTQNVQNLDYLTESYAILHRVHVTLEVESTLSLRTRRRIWDEMALHEPLDFEKGYMGPAGGIQCLESSSVMQHPKYVKDRVIRIRGEASPLLPWPASNADSDQNGKETGGEGASVHNSANGHAD